MLLTRISELHAAYRKAWTEYHIALDFFNQATQEQFEEANHRLSAAHARVNRLKRELEAEMGRAG